MVFHEFCSDGDIVVGASQAAVALFIYARDLECSSAGFS